MNTNNPYVKPAMNNNQPMSGKPAPANKKESDNSAAKIAVGVAAGGAAALGIEAVAGEIINPDLVDNDTVEAVLDGASGAAETFNNASSAAGHTAVVAEEEIEGNGENNNEEQEYNIEDIKIETDEDPTTHINGEGEANTTLTNHEHAMLDEIDYQEAEVMIDDDPLFYDDDQMAEVGLDDLDLDGMPDIDESDLLLADDNLEIGDDMLDIM